MLGGWRNLARAPCLRSSALPNASRRWFNAQTTTSASPLRVCIVGAGPAGFYSAKYLLKDHATARVDMLEALPTPYGLVRSGVAPDHPEVKSVMNDFARVAQHERFNYLGNVRVGKDVHIDELQRHYHAVVLAYGAAGDRALGVPGEDLNGVYGARAFVNWYNGHPEFRGLNPDLSVETAVVVGQGNVALDCARILSKSIAELEHTDICEHALEALRSSRIKTVYVAGRRGSVQAAFTIKEARELTKLAGAQCVIDPQDIAEGMTAASKEELQVQRGRKRMNDLLNQVASGYESATTAERQVHIKFLSSPVALLEDPARPGSVGSVRFEKTMLGGEPHKQRAVGTGQFKDVPAGLVLRSIGYRSIQLDGVPFDAKRGVVHNVQGRVVSETNETIPGLYCSGWLKRGPSGIIGSNITDARETVASILEDAQSNNVLKPIEPSGLDAIRELVLSRDPTKKLLQWRDVERLHKVEEKRGEAVGKPREKLTTLQDMESAVFGASTD